MLYSIFKDLKIIDLSTVLAGPSVATFFAELGADVIKIENKLAPDVTRTWKIPGEKGEISAYFSSVNYKKKYISLNLKIETDRKELYDLVRNADVVISNFKAKDEQKLGVTDELLAEINPKIIHAKINGFGEHSDRIAYDLILQAETGFMSMNGEPNGLPTKMPLAFIDILAGHQLKEAILLAYIQRLKSNKGSNVSVSLYDAAVCSLSNQASNYLMSNHVPKRQGSLHPNIAPYGELFETIDQKHITFAIGSNTHFEKLCTVLQLEALVDNPDYADNTHRVKNRKVLFELIQEKVKQWKSDDLIETCISNFIPAGKVKALDEVFRDEQAQRLIEEEIIEHELTKRVSSIAFQWH